MRLNLGYACISTINPNLKCSQASTKTWLDRNSYTDGRKRLLGKAHSNLKNLQQLLEKNKENNIYAFRLPEQLLPQADLGYYDITEFAYELKQIGKYANKHSMQLSCHPSQYFVLNSTRSDVVDKTIAALNQFADTLAMMELKLVPNLTIHVGAKSGYANKQAALDAFCAGFARLNDNAKRFLVVENDQNSFNIEDCMYIHSHTGIPVVLDNAHFAFNPGSIDLTEAAKLAASTWGVRTPKFHMSSEDESTRHAHADYIERAEFMNFLKAIRSSGIAEACIILEAKQKDKAILELRNGGSDDMMQMMLMSQFMNQPKPVATAQPTANTNLSDLVAAVKEALVQEAQN